jgi:hypothetical protein
VTPTTKPTPLTVSFHDPGEFIEEISRDKDRIERNILRLTVRRRYGEPFITISVVATVVIEGTIVKLEHRIGEAFAGDEKNTAMAAKTQAVLDKLSAAAKGLGLEVRAGVYE